MSTAAPCLHGVPWTDPCGKCNPAASAVQRITVTGAPVPMAGGSQIVMVGTGGAMVPQAGDTAGGFRTIRTTKDAMPLKKGDHLEVNGDTVRVVDSKEEVRQESELGPPVPAPSQPEPRWLAGTTACDHGAPLDKPCLACTGKDPVNHPTHYKVNGLPECIEVIEKLGLGYHAGNALKYLWRAGKKDGAPQAQDFRKAAFYLNRLADLMEGKAGKPGVR